LVSIDGSMAQEAAQQFVAAVTAQVERETAEPIEWLQINLTDIPYAARADVCQGVNGDPT